MPSSEVSQSVRLKKRFWRPLTRISSKWIAKANTLKIPSLGKRFPGRWLQISRNLELLDGLDSSLTIWKDTNTKWLRASKTQWDANSRKECGPGSLLKVVMPPRWVVLKVVRIPKVVTQSPKKWDPLLQKWWVLLNLVTYPMILKRELPSWKKCIR